MNAAPLHQLAPGQAGEVVRIGGPASFMRRLVSLGVAPGVTIRVIRRAPLGDPLQVEFNGCQLSIRLSEAEHVEVAL